MEEWVSGEEPHELTLLPGTYTLHEELAPEGYLVASDVRFEVVEGVPVTRVEMVDDCTRVDAEKVDAATGEPLAGATMQVVDAEGGGHRGVGLRRGAAPHRGARPRRVRAPRDGGARGLRTGRGRPPSPWRRRLTFKS